jgi:hypothetical protein
MKTKRRLRLPLMQLASYRNILATLVLGLGKYLPSIHILVFYHVGIVVNSTDRSELGRRLHLHL